MKKPLIGLTLAQAESTKDCESPHTALVVDRAYAEALRDAGAVLLAIPPQAENLQQLYKLCDGLCFPGGGDIAASMYGQESTADYHRVDAQLDAAEAQLLRWAIADDKPFLAICRGMQLLNVVCGGTLWPDLNMTATTLNHDLPRCQELAHNVAIQSGTKLGEITGLRSMVVNSVHHQGIKDLGMQLSVAAVSDDGLIEAVELPRLRFAIGVQWHPEQLPADNPSRRLFSALVDAASIHCVGQETAGIRVHQRG